MTGVMTDIFEMPSGRFKACFWGHHNDHIMDWRGCNFHRVVIKGQPRKGFETPEEAWDWAMALDEKTFALEYRRAREVNGTFFNDDSNWNFTRISFRRKPTVEVSTMEFYEYVDRKIPEPDPNMPKSGELKL